MITATTYIDIIALQGVYVNLYTVQEPDYCMHRDTDVISSYRGKNCYHDHDRKYPEPDTLFDNYDGRGKAEHNQDMTIEKTLTLLDLKLKAITSLNAEQRQAWDAYYEPRNKTFKDANLEGKDLVRWKYN